MIFEDFAWVSKLSSEVMLICRRSEKPRSTLSPMFLIYKYRRKELNNFRFIVVMTNEIASTCNGSI